MLYEDLLKQRQAWYKTIEKVYCPCISEEVIFNSKGFHHIKYDGLGKARSTKERMYRLGILPLAVPVIKHATKVYEYSPPEYLNSLGKNVEFWALREMVGKRDVIVTVILRRIGSGNITFHSIMKKKDKDKKIT